MTVKIFLRGALIAALYFVLTFFLQPISYGSIQVRVSEVLTVLPYFFPESIIGLTVGCLLANFFFSIRANRCYLWFTLHPAWSYPHLFNKKNRKTLSWNFAPYISQCFWSGTLCFNINKAASYL